MTAHTFRVTALVAAAAALASLLGGCAATLKAGSHIERGAQFGHYRIWEWAPVPEVPTGDPRLDSNPMFERALRSAVEHQLAGKGYIRTTLAGPLDLRVRYHVNFGKTLEVTDGGSSGGTCSGNCEPDAYAYERGALVIDLIDARTSALAWRAWSQDNMDGVIDDQDEMDREIGRIVAAMFKQLPSAP